MKEMIKNETKRRTRRKIIATIAATGGGCLIPVLCVIGFVIIAGCVSAWTVTAKYQIENIKQEAAQAAMSVREYLLDKFLGDVDNNGVFKDSDLNSMAFDRKSLKTMLELVKEYNEDKLEKTIKVEIPGTYKKGTGKYNYSRILFLTNGNTSKVKTIVADKEAYEAWEESGRGYEGTGLKLSELPDYEELKEIDDLEIYSDYTVSWDFYSRSEIMETKSATKKVEITLSNEWIRDRYPVDWQIVYLLCFYDSLDNGGSSTDIDADTGKKIRLKKKYIEEVIADVSQTITMDMVVPDATSDAAFYWAEGYTYPFDAVNYDWGLFAVEQQDVFDYGLYTYYPAFEDSVWDTFRTYKGTFSGYIPVSCLASVRTLTTYEVYKFAIPQGADVAPAQVISDTSKLEALLEKYGHGRTMDMFLYALEELPGGEEIAEKLRKGIQLSEEEKKKQEEDN